MKPQFLIAAPHSGAGKTTVTFGLLSALRRRGLRVQPFKCGPDYLDPQLHTLAAGQTSINLDRYMMTDAHVQEVYARYLQAADVGIVEGVMGLFDGARKMEGSGAALAAFLNIPVILIVDAKAMAYSAAALLYGYKHFYADINIAGVIFNFVNSAAHYHLLQEAAADVGIPALGYLPETAAIYIPSRHLGLYVADETDYERAINQAANELEKHIDLSALLAHCAQPAPAVTTIPLATGNFRIAVARDAAFSFLYRENLRILSQLGPVTYFSPLQDKQLPSADLLYFPGGYPELYLPALSANTTLLDQLRTYTGKILAECGGMMYLGTSITSEDGTSYPMAGVIPGSTSMQPPQLSLGYRQVYFGDVQLKGHEFHYSQYTGVPLLTAPDIRVLTARNEILQVPVFRNENILASYLHFYFGDNIEGLKKVLGITTC
ncbi:cobyrinate a,c-diamide synthase [Chitinophaga polysaccharea]|uniref:cobyrinate a,c-diamide synthase n=1 Tax=Chitinophaga polysaccharea TaxID=1293035 RepID=UPI001455913E|nr:cobyrinate a,c-diamide synthase [Chitinophaga polysaccharea]NLR60636.1 cobyrinate a,c-diamide synthase [Chitinophaga polysaccharea]